METRARDKKGEKAKGRKEAEAQNPSGVWAAPIRFFHTFLR